MSAESALPFARSVLRFEEIPSTNDAARQLAARWSTDELPALLIAERQTAGRGRGSNRWWSDGGSLTFSLLIDPASHGLQIHHEPRLALAAGLAVLRSVEGWLAGAGIGIRWPNDLEVDGRKIAGILCERFLLDCGPRLVIGIGLNVGTRFADAPADVRSLATSIAELNPAFLTFDGRPTVLRQILDHFERQLQRLASDDLGLIDDLNQFNLLSGQRVQIEQGPILLEGTARGIASDGALLLEQAGSIQPVYGGRVLRTQD